MTKLILPPDSFQLGGPNTPEDRGSPGLRVAADKSVLRKPPQVGACPSPQEAPSPCSWGGRHAGPPRQDPEINRPSPSSQDRGQTLELLSAGTGRHQGTDGCCHVFRLLAASLPHQTVAVRGRGRLGMFSAAPRTQQALSRGLCPDCEVTLIPSFSPGFLAVGQAKADPWVPHTWAAGP